MILDIRKKLIHNFQKKFIFFIKVKVLIMQNFRYASQDLRTRGHKVNISRSDFLVVKGKDYAHAKPSYTSQSFTAHAPR